MSSDVLSCTVVRTPLMIRLAEPGRPSVACCVVMSRVGFDGEPTETVWEEAQLSPDDAGDLVGSPRGSAELLAQRFLASDCVLQVWRAAGLGFIEEEALAAHDAAVDEIRVLQATGGRR